MLDELLDLFDRDERKRDGDAPKQGGVRGLLNRLGGDDDHRDYEERKRYSEDDRKRYSEDERHYEKKKKRREFDFFGDD